MRDMKEKVKGMKNKRVLREDPRTFTYREKEEQGRGGTMVNCTFRKSSHTSLDSANDDSSPNAT